MKTLAESPTGLVHAVMMLPEHQPVTLCGRFPDWETWTRIPTLDSWMVGKNKPTIARKIELPKCEKCFPMQMRAV